MTDTPNIINEESEKAAEKLINIAVLSLDIARGDVAENHRRVAEMVKHLPVNTDVILLPELFTTSFMRDTDAMLSCAEFRNGPTIRFLQELSAATDALIAGSYLGKEDLGNGQRNYFNRGFMVTPDGEVEFYDKHHLFCLSTEAELITHGHKRPPVKLFRGWNISMIICYELRFPVWSRNIDMQADVVLVPANWPDARGYAWRQLLIARSIENQVIMVGADRSGTDDYGDYTDLSMITDELGRQVVPPLSETPKGCPPPSAPGYVIATPYGSALFATFSKEKIKKLRQWLPTHRDADRFTIHPQSHS